MNHFLALIVLAGLEYNSSLFIGGDFNSVASGESYIYVADGRGVSVFGKERFDRYGGCMLTGESKVIGYHAGSVYVGTESGLAKLDTSECFKSRPHVNWIHEQPVTALALAGEVLWFADAGGFLYGRDLTSDSLVRNTPIKLAVPPVRIIPDGEKIYLASDTAGLWVVEPGKNVTEATEIKIEGNPAVMDIVFGGEDEGEGGEVRSRGAPGEEGGEEEGFAWLACGEDSLWTVEFKRRGVRVLSKSAASGELLRLKRFGGRLAAAAGTGDFILFSLSDPKRPVLIQREPLEGMAVDLADEGDYCFVSSGSAVVKMLVAGEGLASKGLYYLGRGEGYDLAARVGVGVLALGRSGIRGVEFTDSLALLGTYREPVDCRRVYLYGSEAYALTAGNVLYVADFKDPLRPARRSYHEFSSVVSGLDTRGETILAAEQARGLGSWWRCPCGPIKEQGRWTPGGKVMDVRVKEKLAFVSASSGMLYVVDWSDSTRLEEVASFFLGHDYQRLYLDDELLYALDSTGRLAIIDLSRPTRPGELAVLELTGTPLGLAKEADMLYVAAGGAGVHEIDISRPASPEIVETYDVPSARAVAVAGEQLVVLTKYSLESYKITH